MRLDRRWVCKIWTCLWKVDDALEVDLAAAADMNLLVAGAGDARAGL